MTPEQEEKFEAWYANQTLYTSWSKEILRDGWKYCLEANSIGAAMKDMHSMSYPEDKGSDAPQWVIDMIRTGKPVRCIAWSSGAQNRTCNIVGMIVVDIAPLVRGARFVDDGYNWYEHAEPIIAWVPKDGEAVLFCDEDNQGRAMPGFIRGGILYARGLMCSDWESRDMVAPFDASKIGKHWSKI